MTDVSASGVSNTKLEEALDQLDLAGVLVLQGILNQKALMLLLGPKEELKINKKSKSSFILPNKPALAL